MSSSSSSNGKSISPYSGNLQDRLRNLSVRTNCPTRQENGQRYLGPPISWASKPPQNSEVFISKLPSDCLEDEIYDFCSQAGDVYLIRLMINFENENRGFCFVTFAGPQQAAAAVSLLPQKPLRKGYFVHTEISMNNCSLKMYGLDYRFDDTTMESEIRMNTKDVVNVTIKRNTIQRSLMATLYFDTHQKAAIARRKLSQIANSRWGQNVKVFLWSKKLQNKQLNHNKDYGEFKNKENDKFTDIFNENRFSRCILANIDTNRNENERNNVVVGADEEQLALDLQRALDKAAALIPPPAITDLLPQPPVDPLPPPPLQILKRENVAKSDFHSGSTHFPEVDVRNSCPKEEILSNDGDNYYSQDYSFSSPERSYDSISNYSTFDSFDDPLFSSLSSTLCNNQFSCSTNYFGITPKQEHSLLLSPAVSDDTSTNNAGSALWDSDPLIQWNMDSPCKSEHDLLNFDSPFDISPQKPGGSAIGYSPKQIELILNEASQVLGNFCLSDNA